MEDNKFSVENAIMQGQFEMTIDVVGTLEGH